MKPAHRITPYLFLGPALLVFTFAVLVPFGLTGWFSFLDWNGYGNQIFIGFNNYLKAFNDTVFQTSFLNVSLYILGTLVVEVLLGLLLAGIVLNQKKSTIWLRTAIFIPVMLPMVVISVLWSFIYSADFGLLNASLNFIGLDGPAEGWLGNSNTALLAICLASGWVFSGFYMTIFYTSLRQVSIEVVEAARLDGASERAVFWRIRVPMIRNSIEVAILLCITGGFQSFDLFYVLTNGGPFHATEIPTTYLVNSVFTRGEVGYGSAMAVVLTLVVVTVGLLFTAIRRKRTLTEIGE